MSVATSTSAHNYLQREFLFGAPQAVTGALYGPHVHMKATGGTGEYGRSGRAGRPAACDTDGQPARWDPARDARLKDAAQNNLSRRRARFRLPGPA